MSISIRENRLRALEFRYPQWIPCRVLIPLTYWKKDRQRCEELVKTHPRIFTNQDLKDYGHYEEKRKKGYYTDEWGCVWRNEQDGIVGQVVGHPLDHWDKLKDYIPPDPKAGRDWAAVKSNFILKREQSNFIEGNAGSLFDRMYMLRGFENLMIDIATDDPNLLLLIKMLEEYQHKLVDMWLSVGVDSIYFHTDIGTQESLMISPEKFRQYLKPLFKGLFMKCRKAGVHVRLSSDGVILPIVDDLIECGISMHDPQLRANRLDRIVKYYKGKICTEVDLDRQMFPFCTPGEIRSQVKECIEAMYMPEGGLMLSAANSPDVPFENIVAQCEAFEEFCFPND